LLFYTKHIKDGFVHLDEEESRHLSTVLRRKVGDTLRITDGKGFFYDAELIEMGKKQALARIIAQQQEVRSCKTHIHMAVAPTKMMERFEWFLEKATEIGVDEITPLLCKRSERDTVRHDRMEKILVSAMKQSMRATLPILNELTPFHKLIARHQQYIRDGNRMNAYLPWIGPTPQAHLNQLLDAEKDALILIGPEGDFSPEEVDSAIQAGFQPVSLGDARLRTETAAIFALSIAVLRGV
jgi:16S rRNA (uracil1498-N3)-methyltransferase